MSILSPLKLYHFQAFLIWWHSLFKDANIAIWTHLEQPQSRIETKSKIWTLFEPKHKNFKCLLKIEGSLKKF
jgi:hypothetical protein